MPERPLRREALPALGAPPLQDRLAGARGHACTEAVLPLPSAHIRLIGPLHNLERCKEPVNPAAGDEYRRTDSRLGCPQAEARRKAVERAAKCWSGKQLSTPVETRVEELVYPAKQCFLQAERHRKSSLSDARDAAILAPRKPSIRGAERRRGALKRADCREPLAGRVGSVERGAEIGRAHV